MSIEPLLPTHSAGVVQSANEFNKRALVYGISTVGGSALVYGANALRSLDYPMVIADMAGKLYRTSKNSIYNYFQEDESRSTKKQKTGNAPYESSERKRPAPDSKTGRKKRLVQRQLQFRRTGGTKGRVDGNILFGYSRGRRINMLIPQKLV